MQRIVSLSDEDDSEEGEDEELQMALRRSLDEAAAEQGECAFGPAASASGKAPAAKQRSEQRRKRQSLPSELSTVIDLCLR